MVILWNIIGIIVLYDYSHYSSLQYHMILQKSFWFGAQETFIFKSMFKTVFLLKQFSIFVETIILFSEFFNEYKV